MPTTRRPRSTPDRRLTRKPYSMFCRTVMCGNSAKFWKMVEVGRRSGGMVPTLRPWIRMSPWLTASKPAIMRSVVVLPQPDGPTKETNSPFCT